MTTNILLKEQVRHIRVYGDEKGSEYVSPKGEMKYSPNPIRPSEQKKLPSGGAPWRKVVVEDVPVDWDQEIYQRFGPEYEIQKDRVIERWHLEPVPRAEQILEKRVDLAAEKKREEALENMGATSLQLQEYELVREQAEKALKLAQQENRDILAGEFPMLDADVDVTINPATNTTVSSPLEAARVVLEKRKQLALHFSVIRKERLHSKHAIRSLKSLEEKLRVSKEMGV